MTTAPIDRRVFVSFASEDRAIADLILDGLERDGVRGWIAHRDIPPAASYPTAIRRALEEAALVVLVLTDHANRSPHVRREVEMAFNARTPILPVRMGGTEPSDDLQYFLSTTQWLDAGTTWDPEESTRLLEVVRQRMADGAAAESSPRGTTSRSTPESPYRLPVIAGAVVLVLVGVGAFLLLRSRETAPASPPGEVATGVAGSPPATQPSLPVSPLPAAPASPATTGAASAEAAASDGSASTAASPGAAAPAAATPGVAHAPAAGGGNGSARRVRVSGRDGATYVWIPPGEFAMGCSTGDAACDDDERPVHSVRVGRGFWLARTETTRAQYARGLGRPVPAGEAAVRPVTGVTWEEASVYCAAVGGRLPSEAEWEYAARAGTTTRFPVAPARAAWYAANSNEQVHAVATKAPNAFGLYDTLGNVAEWVRDRYFNTYDDSGEPQEIEEPRASNATAIVRGGSWLSQQEALRVSRRGQALPDAAEPFIGFRCAHDRL